MRPPTLFALLALALAVALGPIAGYVAGCATEGDARPDPEPGGLVVLRLRAVVGDEPLRCGPTYETADGLSWSLTDFRFFVSYVRLVTASGEEVSLALKPDGLWQTDAVALLDFEDGAGACRNGDPATNALVIAVAPPGHYVGVRLRLGVPQALNHGDPTRAAGPLTRQSMHWGWQGGYKFLRLDTDRGRLHLGSTGCTGTLGDITGCARPNRAELALEGLSLDVVAGARAIVDAEVRTDALLDAHTLDAGCMGGASSACQRPFDALGLGLESGLPEGAQAVLVPTGGTP